MKKIVSLLLLVLTVTLFETDIIKASGSSIEPSREIIYLEGGYYLETSIEDVPVYNTISPQSTNTITKTKTAKYKYKSGTVLWTFSITGTFSYDGTTSQCNVCFHSASAPAKTWRIKSVSSYKSGNSATATAIATHSNGSQSQDIVKHLTIQCSSTGVVS